MYRRKQTTEANEIVNLDSLMDILTCVVGVMLFVVIFAVIEARGTNIKMFTPLAKAPAPESKRMIFMCQKQKVVPLDLDPAVEQLLNFKGKLTYKTLPKFVEDANRKNVQDAFFTYRLAVKQWKEGSFFNEVKHRGVMLVIDKKLEYPGESDEEIKSLSSSYVKKLNEMDNRSNWIAFEVDKASLDVFRMAREIAIARGFSVGWDPGRTDFPYKEMVIGGGSRGRGMDAPSRNLGKPQT